MKALLYGLLCLFIFNSSAFAAGGEINAQIIQENKINHTRITDIPNIIAFKNPFGNMALKRPDKTTINSLDNYGTIDGYVIQQNRLDRAQVKNAEINTLENYGKVKGIILQRGNATNSNIIVNIK